METLKEGQGRLIRSVLLFLLGVTSLTTVKIVGYIAIAEPIVCLIAAGLWMQQGRAPASGRAIKGLLLWGSCWLLSAIISDLYRGTEVQLILRGWGRGFSLLASLYAFYALLVNNARGYITYIAGLAVSTVITLYFGRAGAEEHKILYADAEGPDWSHNYVYIVLCVALVAAGKFWEYSKLLTAMLLCVLGAGCILLGSRNIGGAIMVGAIFSYGLSRVRFNADTARVPKGILFYVIGLLLVLTSGAYIGYKLLAARGLLGEEAREKFEMQSQTKFGLIVGARFDVVAGVAAVVDSPIIGLGSWAQDTRGYRLIALELVGFDRDAYAQDKDLLLLDRIPTHSHILEAWVEHGVFGAFFWIYVLWVLSLFFSRSLLGAGDLQVFCAILLLLTVWDILFSPIGNRVSTGAQLAFFAAIVDSGFRRGTRIQHMTQLRGGRHPRLRSSASV